jgi:hypothetical protein
MLLKCKEYFFHKIHDIKNKVLIIIHADKNECQKKRQVFYQTKPRAFSRALHFENLKKQKVISWCIFIEDLIAKHKST